MYTGWVAKWCFLLARIFWNEINKKDNDKRKEIFSIVIFVTASLQQIKIS